MKSTSVMSKIGWFFLTFGTILTTLLGWIYLVFIPVISFSALVLFPIIYAISEWELLLSRDMVALTIVAMPFLYVYWKLTHLKKKLKNQKNIQIAEDGDKRYCGICGDNIGVNSMVNHHLRYHKVRKKQYWIIKHGSQVCGAMVIIGCSGFLIFAGAQCSKQHQIDHNKLEVGELCTFCGNYKERKFIPVIVNPVIDCSAGHNWGKYKAINLTVTKRGTDDFEVLSTKEIQVQRRHCRDCGIKQDL